MSDNGDIDRQIVEFLRRDGTLTNAAICEKLGVSEATVRRRRQRLEEEGYIRIIASANPIKLGYKIVAIIGVQAIKSKVLSVESQLRSLPEVHFLGLTTGHYDIMLEAWLRSNDEVVQFTTEALGRIDGILRTDIFQFLRLTKYYGWSGDLHEAGNETEAS
jgi:Lrp/AsnC family transcriptional regulator, regulator for asnA, asnC and gidA